MWKGACGTEAIKVSGEEYMDPLLAVWVYAPAAVLCVAVMWYCVFGEKEEGCVCNVGDQAIESLWYTGR